MSIEDILAEFGQICKESFSFLEVDHGLMGGAVTNVAHEFHIHYEGSTCRVIVSFEPYSLPWIVLERRIGGRWNRLGLHQAYKRALGNRWPIIMRPSQRKVYDFSTIPLQARILKEYWEQLLKSIEPAPAARRSQKKSPKKRK